MNVEIRLAKEIDMEDVLSLIKELAIFEKDQDDYNSIMLKAIADRLAEALTEYMHEKIRKEV